MKFKVIIIGEYEVNPEHYPGAENAAEMAAIDLKNFQEDPTFAICTLDEDSIAVQVVPMVRPSIYEAAC